MEKSKVVLKANLNKDGEWEMNMMLENVSYKDAYAVLKDASTKLRNEAGGDVFNMERFKDIPDEIKEFLMDMIEEQMADSNNDEEPKTKIEIKENEKH